MKGYENSFADYYPDKELSLEVPGIATYTYRGVLHFEGRDRTVIFEQGEGFGLKQAEIVAYLGKLNIKYSLK